MADTLRKILDIQLNYNDAVKRMAELRQALDEVDKAEAKLAKNRKKMTADEYNRGMSMLAESTKHYRQELNALSKEVQREITDKTAQVGSINQLVASLEKLKSQYTALSAAERTGTTGKTMLNDMKNLAEQIKNATAPLKNFSATVAASGDSIEGMKTKLRQLTQEYQQLTEAERKGTTGQTKLAEIAKLSKEIEKEETVLRQAKKANDEYSDSVVGMRSKLSGLIRDFDRLSKAERTGDKGRQLASQIRAITKELKEAEQSTGRFSRNVGNYTGSMLKGFKQLFIQVALGFTTIGQFFVGIGNAFKEGIETVTQFNREVSKLAAILQTSADGVSALVAQAKQLGATTRYTAAEVVQLQTELAKLGYQQSQIINMSESVLHFAQATGTDLASAAGVAGAALRIFGADSTQTAKYVDMMSAATAKSALNFEYIKTALPIVGGAADMFGFSLQDVLALLGQLANSGMEASMAATATRNIFLKLADSNGKLAQALGKPIKSLDDLLSGLEELRAKGANLNDALELTNVRAAVSFTRFLNTTAAARKLSQQLNWSGISYNEFKEKADEAGMSVEDFKKAIDNSGQSNEAMEETAQKLGLTLTELHKIMNDCTGTADEMAKTMEENLGGDITRLKSAWDDFMLSLYNGQGILRWVTQKLLSIVQYMGSIARSAEESMNIAADVETQKFIEGSTFSTITSRDLFNYNEIVANYKKQGMKVADAEKEAQKDIIDAINLDTEQFKNDVEKAQSELDEVNLANPFLALLNNDDLKDELKSAKERSSWISPLGDAAKVTVKQVEAVIAARAKVAKATGKLNSQETRLEVFQSAASKQTDKSGLGTESDKEINARWQGQKQAYKKMIDALKAYNKSVLGMTREGGDAVLKELAKENDERLTQDMAAAEKRLAALDEKYQEEINQMKYKIEVDLKPRPKATPQEIAQLNEAVDLYEKAIINKEEEWRIERKRLMDTLVIELVERENTLRQMQLESLQIADKKDIDRIRESYALRGKIIDDEEKKELAQLEIDASKDARIEETKEKRKQAIIDKYRKKRLESLREQNKGENQLVIDNLGALGEKAVRESDRAKINEQIAYAELGNTIAQGRDIAGGETEEAYQLRVAAAYRKVAEASDYKKQKVMEDNLEILESQRKFYRGTTMNLKQEKDRADAELDQLMQRGKLAMQTAENYSIEMREAEGNVKMTGYDLAMHLVDNATNAASAFSTLFSSISDGIEQNMEDNEEWIRTAKKLSLASVYLAQGVAIAEAIKNATKDPSSFNIYTMLANIATAVTAVVAATIQARKSVSQAQFAKGAVDIQGAGTTTSDSIPARISRGESVMTAKATEMFGGLLVIMNKIAAQPSVTLPTQYSRYNPMQTNADIDRNTEAMKEAVREIHPVVSVREITSVKNRVKAIETLDTF